MSPTSCQLLYPATLVLVILNSKLKWCLGPESNRHGIRYRGILSPLRLPIPPPRQIFILCRFRSFFRPPEDKNNNIIDTNTRQQLFLVFPTNFTELTYPAVVNPLFFKAFKRKTLYFIHCFFYVFFIFFVFLFIILYSNTAI